MAGSIYGLGQGDGALPTTQPTAGNILPSQQSQAAEFEATVFDEAEPIAAASLPQMTVESIVRMFCVSSLYREAFNSHEWGE